jgi:hypothetical protein
MSHDIVPAEPETPHPAASPIGELPDDFFAGPGRVGDDLGGDPLPPRRPAGESSARDGVAQRPILPIVGAVLLGNVLLFLGGVLAGWSLAHKSVAPPAGVTPPDLKGMTTALAQLADIKASRTEVEGLRSEVAALTRRLAQLQGRVEAQPEPEPEPAPSPDLGPLQARVDELVKVSGRLSSTPDELRVLEERVAGFDRRMGALDERVRTLGERAVTLDEALGSLRREVASNDERSKRADTTTGASGAAGPAAGDAEAAMRAVARGAALFEERRYAEARDVFLEQIKATPDDARLWYYAALANGSATRDWKGETERLVKRGMERERAGTPGRAEIDALLDEVPSAQAVQWLRAWRQRALRQ